MSMVSFWTQDLCCVPFPVYLSLSLHCDCKIKAKQKNMKIVRCKDISISSICSVTSFNLDQHWILNMNCLNPNIFSFSLSLTLTRTAVQLLGDADLP